MGARDERTGSLATIDSTVELKVPSAAAIEKVCVPDR
jgi:hypothetical protein